MIPKPNSKPGKDGAGQPAELPLDTTLFAPGDRVCVAVSGGADSTALLRILLARREDLGIVLSVVHVEHGLRGDAASRDAAFAADLAEKFNLPCEVVTVDTRKRAAEHKESIEEAARNLRYQVFREILAADQADEVATAHTLADQAETVLMKLLRGAWTEGLSGIHPVLLLEDAAGDAMRKGSRSRVAAFPARPAIPGSISGSVVRPLLAARRSQIEAYLRSLRQTWCEDATNRSADHTRNRIRHELLPILRGYNPRIEQMLAHVAANARAEEQHWRREMARLLPQLLLPGKPVRGGGRSVSTRPGSAAVAMEVARLQALDDAVRRRVLRAAAELCGATLDFEATEKLTEMATSSHPGVGNRLELPGGVRAERSARELRLEHRPRQPLVTTGQQSGLAKDAAAAIAAIQASIGTVYHLPVPGTVKAPAFQAVYRAEIEPPGIEAEIAAEMGDDGLQSLPDACVRAWQAGDRVMLRYSRGPKKVKEVLEKMGIRGEQRVNWPVVVWQGKIVWMRGVEVEPVQGAHPIERESGLRWRVIENLLP